eukprot:TRINITY_DN9942_c0_g2_i1.p1 TRINITY_DN9942_c0_g2~~TRINITY_DN9942_c0_g2_i1.p1  ORF type:complete len:829 (-),score=165.57 TRINITY_DN9942_c0_g2_i1:52-2538(-)
MPRICEVGGGGLFLPLLGDDEQRWPPGLRVVLYLLGLLWCFLGVGIIADIFMGAIERVTSKKVRKTLPGGKKVTCTVWNATVANLTLMALGSSAPEILLSVIELLANNWYSGELGPSTIVGSAAFNLFCIIAVCIVVIPDGEVRIVKEQGVFAITGFFSMFAYAWLVVILMGFSVDAILPWEGILTFLFFPVLIVLAFLADKGYIFKSKPSVDDGAAAAPSRACRRVEALRMLTAGKKGDILQDNHLTVVQFSSDVYELSATLSHAMLSVIRAGPLHRELPVLYSVVESTEEAAPLVVDNTCGEIVFGIGESETLLKLPLNAPEEPPRTGSFSVQLTGLKTGGRASQRSQRSSFSLGSTMDRFRLGSTSSCQVRIFASDKSDPALNCVLAFLEEEMHVPGPTTTVTKDIVVCRDGGLDDTVRCRFRTERGTAVPVYDYIEKEGTLTFYPGQTQARIQVVIVEKWSYEAEDNFRIVLFDPENACFSCSDDGGKDESIGTVVIGAREETNGEGVKKMTSTGSILKLGDRICNLDACFHGLAQWKAQAVEAIFVNGSLEEQREASGGDVFIHVLSLPWKLFFVMVPPPAFCDGWVCFVVAIVFIGFVTALISDMASLFGCVASLPDSITAITFVALGTSLPDTFASKTAAVMDDCADASIGNVTGSNSVNVFLGLGLPWMMGAIKWASGEVSDEWKAAYPHMVDKYPKGAFIVEAGDLGFSVACFLICCTTVLGGLVMRRRTLGYELGGEKATKIATGTTFVLLWFYYVSVSSWKVLTPESTGVQQVLAIIIGYICVMAIAGIFLVVFRVAFPPTTEEKEALNDNEVLDTE